jgi:hypothetical protein
MESPTPPSQIAHTPPIPFPSQIADIPPDSSADTDFYTPPSQIADIPPDSSADTDFCTAPSQIADIPPDSSVEDQSGSAPPAPPLVDEMPLSPTRAEFNEWIVYRRLPVWNGPVPFWSIPSGCDLQQFIRCYRLRAENPEYIAYMRRLEDSQARSDVWVPPSSDSMSSSEAEEPPIPKRTRPRPRSIREPDPDSEGDLTEDSPYPNADDLIEEVASCPDPEDLMERPGSPNPDGSAAPDSTEEPPPRLSPFNDPLPPPTSRLELPAHLTEIQCAYFWAQAHYHNQQTVVEAVRYVVGDDERRLSFSTLKTCLKRTALGQPWFPGYKGGADRYLCKADGEKFVEILREHAERMNSLTTVNALAVARGLREARYRKAIALLDAIGSNGLANQLREQAIVDPDPTWLNHIAQGLQISIKVPQTIEEARRRSCNTRAIEIFFQRFSELMQRPACMIINCDETHVSSRKRFKVVVPKGCAPLKPSPSKLPHFSAMCTISASGHAFRPSFILPECCSLPTELDRAFASEAYFLSTRNGWMTQRSFLIYCHILIEQLQLYRQLLPSEFQDQRFLLLLDGHISRFTYDAMALLSQSGIDVLVFPAHCTHVLQPFDVSVAAALKKALRRFCEYMVISLNQFNELEMNNEEPKWMAEKRYKLFKAFMDAWSDAATRANIQAGFAAAGISPLNPQEPLRSTFTTPDLPGFCLYPSLTHQAADMNCTLATHPATLAFLAENGKRVLSRMLHSDGTERIDPIRQYGCVIGSTDPDGRLLSSPTPHLQMISPLRYNLTRPEAARRWYSYICRRGDPAAVWHAVQYLGWDESTILVICREHNECEAYSHYFEIIRKRHIVFWIPSGQDGQVPANGTQDDQSEGTPWRVVPAPAPERPRVRPRRRVPAPDPHLPDYSAWVEFQDEDPAKIINICLTTAFSVSGCHCVRRLWVVYTFCPTESVFLKSNMKSHRILICASARKIETLATFTTGTFQALHPLT